MPSETFAIAAWLPALLQTSDPLFPTGAYAHSLGLEEIVRLGGVRDEASLGTFLSAQLMPQLQWVDLPYLRFAIEAAHCVEALSAIDQEIDAWKLALEARSSSCQIGTRRLAALRTTSDDPRLLAYTAAIKNGHAHGHHLCACALQALLQHTPLEAALLVYGYQTLAGACMAALKLIRIGQDGCQRVLTNALRSLPDAVSLSHLVKRQEAGCFSPLLEIASMRHAFANERLFIS
jgi:urease accessory protein